MVEFLKYLLDRVKAEVPVSKEIAGQHYAVQANGTLGAPIRPLAPQWEYPTLKVSSLDGLIAAYTAKLDNLPTEVAVRIVDYLRVELISLKADEYGRRHVWASATYLDETPFTFGKFYTPEEFLIDFRSSFYFNDQAVNVQRLASTVSHETSVSVADDGMSQAITIKDGAVTRTACELPADGIPLVPWRTFREVNPVESKFLLRMKGIKDELPRIGLFEIDAKWKVDTVKSIQGYLFKALPDVPIIV
jgi:hypothetical protein